MSEDRRLAAIMFTDIVGYTALMGSDEDKAFKVLRRNRDIQRPIIKKYHGEWLKEMGDGILASFRTASDAVRCAGEIQHAAEKEGINLRIGIHTGEVVFEGGDVLGDGVNVASRLEEMAEEGCINISGAVYKDIKNKAGLKADFIEEKTLKNVEEPVKVYKVHLEKKDETESPSKDRFIQKSAKKVSYYVISGIALIAALMLIWKFIPLEIRKTTTPKIEDEKSIAVIPFWNDSPDADNAYFCSGMEEEIRIQLLKISDLLIESRQSVEKYRENSENDIISIGRELNVAYIVEGSVRKIGDNVRVTVQLINARTGDHVWGDSYDGDYTQELLTYQSNTAKKIASELHAVIKPEEEKRIDKIPTNVITSYDYALRGEQALNDFWVTADIKYLHASLTLFNKALENDPDFVRAIIGKGQFYLDQGNYDSAFYFAEKALRIDPEAALGHGFMGSCNRTIGQYDEAILNFSKAISISPSDWWINLTLGNIYIQNKSDIIKGLPYIQKAYELCTEERGNMYHSIGLSYFHIDDFEKADYYYSKTLEFNAGCGIIMQYGWLYHNKGEFQKALEIEDSLCDRMDCNVICDIQHFYTHLYLKNFELAYEYYNKAIEAGRDPTYRLDLLTISYVLKELGRKEESESILNKLHNGIINQSENYESAFSNFILASIYAMWNEKQKAMDYLLRFETFGYNIWFNEIKIYPLFENLWNEPDFIALVDRINKEKAELRSKIRQMEASGEINF